MVSITDTKCSSRARRAIGGTEEKWWWTQSISNPSQSENSLLTGKRTGKFRQIGPPGAILKADTRANSETCSTIPCPTEQGIILEEHRNLGAGTGNVSKPKSPSAPDEVV
jgi:hypothetical protein